MKVVVLRPEENPEVKEISGDLKSLQDIVGGYIELVPGEFAGCRAICNEEGKLIGLPFNFDLGYDYVVGTVLFVKVNENEIEGLSDALVNEVIKWISQHWR